MTPLQQVHVLLGRNTAVVIVVFMGCVLSHTSPSSASSKAERPPSLSLYPNVEGMVRGGLGGARIMPGKDIWQVSELGQSTFCSAYQVGKTAALSSSMIMGSGRGSCTAARPAGHAHTDRQPRQPVASL